MSPACCSSSRRSPRSSAPGRRDPRPRPAPAAPPIDGSRSGHSRALGEADGALPDGTTVFDEVPGVARLDPALLDALRSAATDAANDGVEFVVDSGWRSPAYQERLLREAIAKYGSEAEARRWVATPDTSAHVSGDAVDIGPSDAAAWLSEHGAAYGLCRIYGNEPWHYELRPEAPVARLSRRCTPTRRTTRGCSSERETNAPRPRRGRPDQRGLWFERTFRDRHRHHLRHREQARDQSREGGEVRRVHAGERRPGVPGPGRVRRVDDRRGGERLVAGHGAPRRGRGPSAPARTWSHRGSRATSGAPSSRRPPSSSRSASARTA